MPTVTTSTNWFSRVGNSFVGVLFGLTLFIGSFILLVHNEGRAVFNIQKLLSSEKQEYITASVEAIDPTNEGKLIYLTGEAQATTPIEETTFGVSGDYLKT